MCVTSSLTVSKFLPHRSHEQEYNPLKSRLNGFFVLNHDKHGKHDIVYKNANVFFIHVLVFINLREIKKTK